MRVTGILLLIAGVAILTQSACSKHTFRDGPQIGRQPEGFVYDGNAEAARLVLPDREKVRQRGYGTLTEPYSSIMITQYTGGTSDDEIMAARDASRERYKYLKYGDIEELIIDERPALGWTETQFVRGELASVEYVAVVSYEQATYSIAFYAAQPEYRNTAYQKEIVSTFFVAE
jgi:hypothetical protein